MRVQRDASSPWGQRVWFEDREFDDMMDEARLRAGDVFVDGRGVDVEAILEHVYKIVPDYSDLPDGVLGRTIFHRDGKADVEISRTLCDVAESDVIARRRLHTTVAHECAHIVEHTQLHIVDTMTPSLFGDPPRETPRVLCSKAVVEASPENGQRGYDGQWWEYQANRGMASLLLPRRDLIKYLNSILAARGFRTVGDAIAAGKIEEVVRDIMRAFDVSMTATLYRLQEIGTVPRDARQAMLTLEER